MAKAHEDKAKIDAEFNKILDDYPEHRDPLKVVLTRIRDNSSETHTPNPKTVQLYLYPQLPAFCKILPKIKDSENFIGDPSSVSDRLRSCHERMASRSFVLRRSLEKKC